MLIYLFVAVVYLKNMVTRYWESKERDNLNEPIPFSIHELDKTVIRANIVGAVISAPLPIRYVVIYWFESYGLTIYSTTVFCQLRFQGCYPTQSVKTAPVFMPTTFIMFLCSQKCNGFIFVVFYFVLTLLYNCL